MPTAVELIINKRDGGAHTPAEIKWLVDEFLAGGVTEYQMSAWLMAVVFRGLLPRETFALTQAMLHSGKVLRLARVSAPRVDKHSTGGVGDKISICLAPLVAAAGVAVPMISGRGLGHTGGTLDKLEAIPGYRVDLGARRFEAIVRQVGVSMIGQTREIAPADRRIYALRDVTGTVESIPLIVASILSKKLAEGIDGLVLDVKVGRGAFMKNRAEGRALARLLCQVGNAAGKRVVALLTDMSVPIGRTIGNALELREAIDVLKNGGPGDTRELTLALGVEMLRVAGVERDSRAARKRLSSLLESGAAFDRFERMVAAHGGDRRVLSDTRRLPRVARPVPVESSTDGWVTDVDPLILGRCAVRLGAGRLRADQAVDPAAGIELLAVRGDRIGAGQPLALLHARRRSDALAVAEDAKRAFQIGSKRRISRSRVLERFGR
jgi:pyrimidine-nucleoside phosphorylase